MTTTNFHVMVKPTGSKCNIDCSYCFYLEKEKLYPDSKSYMSHETLEEYIKQNISSQPHNATHYTFSWQGGEPTLAGIDFYREVVRLQRVYSEGKYCENTFQTNGIALNDEWCNFFAKERFLVGLSLDGEEEHHDLYRKKRSGKGTHKSVLRALDLLKAHQVDFNILTTVHPGNADHGADIYHYFKSLGAKYIQFTPLVERRIIDGAKNDLFLVSPDFAGGAEVTSWSVTPEKYLHFLIDIFKQWINGDVGNIFITNFETYLGLYANLGSNSCIHAEICGSNIVLEHNGDVYSCDHFVYNENLLGNIHSDSIKNMLTTDKQISFGVNKKSLLSKDCIECEYLKICNGGCPKHRFTIASDGKKNLSYFCKAYKGFISYSLPYYRIILDAVNSGLSKENLHRNIEEFNKR